VVLSLVITLAALAQTLGPRRALPIGAVRISISHAQVNPDEGTVVRAFVATGSLNNKCLATLAESNFASTGITMFCAPRNPSGHKGILVSVFFPNPPPDDLILDVTVYQEGARFYAKPVLCGNEQGC
jgi:hypothetical protein